MIDQKKSSLGSLTDEDKVLVQIDIWRALEEAGYRPSRDAVVKIRRAVFAALKARGIE